MIDQRARERLASLENDLERLSSKETHGPPVAMRLNFSQATDIWAGAAITGGTVYDVISNQNFTIGAKSAIAVMEFNIGVSHIVGLGSVSLARLVVDNAALNWGPPQWGVGSYISSVGRTYAMKLLQGVHTVRCQIYCSVNSNVYLRPASVGIYEFVTIQVDEYPQ